MTLLTLAGIVLIALVMGLAIAAAGPFRLYRYEFVGGHFDGLVLTDSRWHERIAKPVPGSGVSHVYDYAFCSNHETDGVIVVTMRYSGNRSK